MMDRYAEQEYGHDAGWFDPEDEWQRECLRCDMISGVRNDHLRLLAILDIEHSLFVSEPEATNVGRDDWKNDLCHYFQTPGWDKAFDESPELFPKIMELIERAEAPVLFAIELGSLLHDDYWWLQGLGRPLQNLLFNLPNSDT